MRIRKTTQADKEELIKLIKAFETAETYLTDPAYIVFVYEHMGFRKRLYNFYKPLTDL